MDKTLTVSIASYNVERFLKQTLDSICLSDAIDDIEVIIVNDGSKDNTAAIAKEYVDKYPQIEFLRDKDKPFIWRGFVDLTEQKTIPVDRKIIFLYPGENLYSEIYISVPEKKFTWPKNWTWAGLYKNDYLGGDNQYHWINPGFKFPDQGTLHYGSIDFKEEEIEMSFEEGYEELPIMPYNSNIKKLILPNSLKKITKNRTIRIGDSSDYKGTIVFPEGAKITIEPGAIVCDNLSISTLKTLKAMGYNTDN